MTQPAVVQRFGGLNLRDDPGEVGLEAAIDLLNIEPSNFTVAKTRAGLTASVTTLTAGTPLQLFPTSSFLYYVSHGASYTIDAISTGGVVTNLGTYGSPLGRPAAIGTPTTSVVFFPVAAGTLRKSTSGGALADSVGKPFLVSVTPVDNRLAQAAFNAAGDSPTGSNATNSTVFFSDEGAPETFGADNYVHLHPGDGERIMAMVTWRDLLIVFKQTRAFVFYGTSVDGTGGPVFEYRTVRLPSPITSFSAQVASAGPDGVYFAAKHGIYRMAGGTPELISGALDPIFSGAAASAWVSTGATIDVEWVENQLFVRYTTATATLYLVWDADRRAWSAWKFPWTTTLPVDWPLFNSSAGIQAFNIARDGRLLLRDRASATDDGTAIASYYQSGWSDLGTPRDKRIRSIAIWGTGTPTLSVFSNRGTSDAKAAAVTLGTSPAVARGEHATARTGRQFSVKLSATSGAWTAASVELEVADQKVTT